MTDATRGWFVVAGSAIMFAAGLVLRDSSPKNATVSRVGDTAPLVSARVVSGTGAKGSLSDYRGRVVVLAVWATWCPACQTELPQLADLQKRYGDRGLQVVAISIDGWFDRSAISTFVQPLGTGMSVLHDPRKRVVAQFGIAALPAIIMIDRKGVVRQRFSGAVTWDADSPALKSLEKILTQ